MEFKVVYDRRNPYLDRVEVLLEVRHEGRPTPSRGDIARYIMDRLGYPLDKVLIASIETFTGMNKSEVLIYYYPDGIDWSTIEPVKRGKVIRIGEEESEA
ncbi:MAG TPA: hypothetical protein EYH44_01390 [Thermoprotei archaeon]|nr:hypothetical protein [Thermoprotei archaeon]